MSIASIRDSFNNAVKDGTIRCVSARMYYTECRKMQIIEFDIVRPSDNMKTTVVTDPIPHVTSTDAAAAHAAVTAAKAFTKS